MMKYDFFYGRYHPLSHWYLSDFILSDMTFNCVEQWMMFSKAYLFGDKETAIKMLNESNPSNQRKLGRQVKYFKNDIWEKKRENIIYKGNYVKFSQNSTLREYLLNTGNSILAEASPTDLVWGIGYGVHDENRLYPERWRGKNLLGKILMQVREDLRKEQSKKQLHELAFFD